MRTRVYVAGPISQGDLAANVRQATEAGLALLRAGYAPLVPHLSCYMGGPRAEKLPGGTTPGQWYATDLPWVAVSDAVLRLPGESVGADLEEAEARTYGVPVFYGLPHLFRDLLPFREDFNRWTMRTAGSSSRTLASGSNMPPAPSATPGPARAATT